MIVRILEEGQYEIAERDVDALSALDAALEGALEAGDEARFREALRAVLAEVRSVGTPVDGERIVSSDLALPNETMGLAEVSALLASEEGLG